MTYHIEIQKISHSHIKVICELDVALELTEAFKFEVKGAKYSPLYKMGKWDGFVRLFNAGSRTMGAGLFSKLIGFCDNSGYTYDVLDSDYGKPTDTGNLSLQEVTDFIQSLAPAPSGVPMVVRDYQIRGVHIALNELNAVLLSATGSGKSFIIACIFRYITDILGGRCLLVVPTVGLTTQMISDFDDYFASSGYVAEDNIHLISAGVKKETDKPIVISTFQSLKGVSPEYLNSFTCIMSDEGHKIQSDSFKKIYDAATEVRYRLACTGTLHDTKCDLLQIQSLTGPIHEVAVARDLIAAGQLVPLKVKGIVLNYDSETCKAFKKVDYEGEIGWITSNKRRDVFIEKLARSTKGTTLVLYRYKEHGKSIFDLISKNSPRPVFYIDGDTKSVTRDEVRVTGNEDDCIIVASYGVFSTGINLPAIENVIIGHPVKSKLTYLQSIGRGLRLKDGKNFCRLFDIGDNLSHKRHVNHTFKHFGERMNLLTSEGHEFDIINVEFK